MTDTAITPERLAGMQQMIADTGLTRDEQRELLGAVRSLQMHAQDRELLIKEAAKVIARKDEALQSARMALEHDSPDACWATGPLTGDPIEDLIVCPGCRALAAINSALTAFRSARESKEPNNG